MELDQAVNTVKLLEQCLASNVAFVPVSSFYPNQCKLNTMRINFSNMREDKIQEGIARIRHALNMTSNTMGAETAALSM